MVESNGSGALVIAQYTGACEAMCPKDISVKNIGIMNREYLKAIVD